MKTDPAIPEDFRIPETWVHEIDRQHAELLQSLENLTRWIGMPTELEDMMGAILKLNSDVDEHFQFEEAFLRTHGYPKLESHVREHDAMREKIAELTGEILDGEEITMEIIDLLRGWFRSHVQNEDSEYADFLKDGARFDFHALPVTIPAL